MEIFQRMLQNVQCVFEKTHIYWNILQMADKLKEICPRGNNKVIIYISLYHDTSLLFMLELYWPETWYMCVDKTKCP